ncbi:MAG: AAA family ATPase [bacterium]|nr:AAA family ATPase [bacterium]
MTINKLGIEKFSAKNYKNLVLDDGIKLNCLNIFIGPNGSGKSNFISALKFLKDSFALNPDENRGITRFEEAISYLGDSKILDASLKKPANLSFGFEFSSQHRLNLQLNIDQKGSIKVNEESLINYAKGLSNPYYFYKCHDKDIGKGVVSIKEDPDTAKSHFEVFEEISTKELSFNILPELLENSDYPPEKVPFYKIRREILENVSSWKFYNAGNMNLMNIRNSEPKIGPSDVFLSESGENLALVLDNLSSESLDFEESINRAMKSIIRSTRKVRPIKSGRLSLAIEWHFNDIEEPFYLNDMSDGTVRMLCWAVILHSSKLPKLLVIDEPELGIHVSWMPILAEWIKSAAEKTQVIIASHSPDLLDYFTDHWKDVFVFSLGKKDYFKVNQLSETDLKEKFDEEWQLGDLNRVGDPSVGGWPW